MWLNFLMGFGEIISIRPLPRKIYTLSNEERSLNFDWSKISADIYNAINSYDPKQS